MGSIPAWKSGIRIKAAAWIITAMATDRMRELFSRFSNQNQERATILSFNIVHSRRVFAYIGWYPSEIYESTVQYHPWKKRIKNWFINHFLELRTALSEFLSESPIDKVLLLIILTSGGLLQWDTDFDVDFKKLNPAEKFTRKIYLIL